MSEFRVSPRQFVAGIDPFATTLELLMNQVHSHEPRTHDRAVALFSVIDWCVMNGQPIPWRVGMDLLNAFTLFTSLDKDAATLDAALGLQRPGKAERGSDAIDYSSGLTVAAAVVAAVDRAKAASTPVDDELFEAVGQTLDRPISKSSASSIYYANREKPEVFLELQARAAREAKEAIEAVENREAAEHLRNRLDSAKD